MAGFEPKLRYRFGPFELDPVEGSLTRNGTRVRMQDLPLRLLVLLVERHGEIVTREETRQRLWPENTFVEFDNSLGVAIRKVREALHDDAESPRYVETIPRRGYRFLAPVTESGTVPAAPASPPARSFRAIAIVSLAALALLLAYSGILYFRPPPAPPKAVRRSVAVLGFRNLAGNPDDAWLSSGFSEMLSTELAAGGELRLISGEDVSRAKSELPLVDEDSLARSTLARLRINPGADVVVLGSYTRLTGEEENRIRLDLRLQDTLTGSTIFEQAFTGTQKNLFDLVSQAGARLRESLGVRPLTSQIAAAARAALPSNQAALQLYTEGLARLRAFDYPGARDVLIKAIAADPDYPLAHSALAEAWDHLGFSANALAETRRAMELSGKLPRADRLLIEGRYREEIDDWPGAVASYQARFNLFHDDLDAGLRLAAAQRRVNPADCLRTLEALRHLRYPAGADPRIDIEEASAWINQDLGKAHAAARRAVEKGNAQGSHILVARAYGFLCQMGGYGDGSAEEAIAACESARQSSAAAGDRNGEARNANDLAGIYFQQGDLARAETMWREAIPEFRQVGDLEGLAAASNNLGDVFLAQGDLDAARRSLEQAIPNYQAIEDKDGLARILNDLADVSRQRGDLEAATTSYQQAKATANEIDDKSVIAYVLTGLGDVLVDRGDLSAARKSYTESLALRKQAGETQTVAETEVALARLSIEEGHAADAETTIRQCIRQFHQRRESDDELAAIAVLIQALCKEGKVAEAQAEAAAAIPLATKCQNRRISLEFALAVARTSLASGQPESAKRQLEQIVQGARAHEFLGLEFEARLSLAELSKAGGRAADARERLDSLEKAARTKGFVLIARKAAAARG